MCLHILRNQVGVGVGQGKVLTPLQRLLPNQPEWPGMCLKAVLAHREQGGRHWIAYLEVHGGRLILPMYRLFRVIHLMIKSIQCWVQTALL